MTASNPTPGEGEKPTAESRPLTCRCNAEWETDLGLEELAECPDCGAETPVFQAHYDHLVTEQSWVVDVRVEVPEDYAELAELMLKEHGADRHTWLADLLRLRTKFEL